MRMTVSLKKDLKFKQINMIANLQMPNKMLQREMLNTKIQNKIETKL